MAHRKAPPPYSDERSKRILDCLNACERKASWTDFFTQFVDGPAVAPRDLLEMLRYWKAFPHFWQRARERNDATGCLHAGVFFLKATQSLRVAAEARDLDSSPIEANHEIAHEVLHKHPELAQWGDWPDCLWATEITGPERQLNALREIRGLLGRLEAKLLAELAEEGRGNCKPGSESCPSPLTENERRVLRILAEARDATMLLADIEARVPISRRTLGPILTDLRNRGLTSRPKGPRRGEAITSQGLDTLRSGKFGGS